MKLLSTYLRGKSLTVCFTFPEDYDMANIGDLNASIGSKQFTGDDIDISGQVACVRLRSEDTYKLTGDYPIIISIDDKTRGVIPIYVGDIRFVTHRNTLNNASTNEQNDIVIALSITQTTIDVDSVLYDVMKGDKGDAGTIEVGEVTTGDAGTDVFVENVGTSSEAVLNFTIPRGDAGYTPYIGVNGNWFINGVDTGVQAEGDATEAWVAQNYLSKLDFVGEFEPVRDKLAGIEDNANNYVHPATHPPEIIEQDANNRFVTDAEKSTWNGKQNDLGFTPENAANKQNSLAADGTGAKYPTVDAVNEGLALKADKDSFALHGYDETEPIKTLKEVETDLENAIFKTINIGSGGMVTLKPTTKALNYKLTLHENAMLFIDITKMVSQIGSARCRFIIDMPVARTITFANPIVWGGDLPNLSQAGQYIFEIVDLGDTPLIWLVAKTTKKTYSGVTLFVDSEGADYSESQINGEIATRVDNSWAKPYKYLQNAINDAVAGDVIFVKEGVYKPTHLYNTTSYSHADRFDTDVTFTPKSQVDMYGGFIGNEEFLWQRETDDGLMVNKTILDGDLQGDGIEDNCADNVVRTVHITTYTYINGFVVENGHSSGNGGGFLNRNTNTYVVINCEINSCSANQGGGSYYGTIYNATFSNCSATDRGGGSYAGTLYNATFSNCSATDRGGGSYAGTLYNATFSNCSATNGGGSYNGTIYNSTLNSCSAAYRGGGSYYGTIYNSTFNSCSANQGGGSYYGTIYNSTFNSCSANQGGGTINSTVYNSIASGCKGGLVETSGAFASGYVQNSVAVCCKGGLASGMLYGDANGLVVLNSIGDASFRSDQGLTGGNFVNCLSLNNFNKNNVQVGSTGITVGTNKKVFRNNAYDVPHSSNTNTNPESDIDLSTCIENLTLQDAGITVPSFVGLPQTPEQELELKEYVENIREHLKPLKTSILKGRGINNATYPNPTDFEGIERGENCTIGAFEAHEE